MRRLTRLQWKDPIFIVIVVVVRKVGANIATAVKEHEGFSMVVWTYSCRL